MALGKCRECGQEVSTTANKCPHCGCDQPATSARAYGTITLVAVVIGIIAMVWVFTSINTCNREMDRSLQEAQKNLDEAQKALDDWMNEYGG